MSYSVISFATAGAYRVHLERLIASCENFGIPIDHEIVQPRGSWVKNCAYKARFIRDRVEKAEHPVVWVDADGEFVAPPIAFDLIDCDMAAFWLKQNGDTHLLSGTLYFRRSPRVMALLNDWCDECDRSPDEWDQRTLEKALRSYKTQLNIHELSESYVYIVDPYHFRLPSIKPVIVHHQASRMLKRVMQGVA